MAEFSQLVKKFDKLRDYMRDFYVFGFKARGDFTQKSARSYDNERRRCADYLGEYMQWEYGKQGKNSFISVDCGTIPMNPLYALWQSKSFTANDIMLHFYVLSALQNEALSVEELTSRICLRSGVDFDVQTVRGKCREYSKNGLLQLEKRGRAHCYICAARDVAVHEALGDALAFFQGAAPFGEIGSYLMAQNGVANELFVFKHQYIAHTLEDGVLFDLLRAMRQGREVQMENRSERSGKTTQIYGLPLKIFVSVATGRRYICVYSEYNRRFHNFRLDYIKRVSLGEESPQAAQRLAALERNLDKIWGTGLGGRSRSEILCMKLHIDEKSEGYVLNRLRQEGRGGRVERVAENTFLYTKEVFDTMDMSPWIKTFIGRILALEGTNRMVINRVHNDIRRMAAMYDVSRGEGTSDAAD